jgi:hypothetical protein
MASERKKFRPMDAESVKLRGRVMDELQARIAHIQHAGKQVPKLWHDKAAELSETHDASFVEHVHEWMVKDLPPKEYHAVEITWDTYADFGNEMVDKLTMYACRQNLLGTPSEEAIALIKEIFDVRESAVDPATAMAELTKIRSRALTELKRFTLVG